MKSKKSLNPQENRRVQRFYFYMTVKDRIIKRSQYMSRKNKTNSYKYPDIYLNIRC